MNAVIARYLPDFTAPPPPPAVTGEPDFTTPWFRPAVAAPEPARPAETESEPEIAIAPLLPRSAVAATRPEEDREALIAAAEARGYEQGRAEALAEAQARAEREREEQSAAFEDRLAQARRDWTEAHGAALATEFAAAIGALDATLSSRVARLIAPVLSESLQRQALDALAAALRKILAEPQRPAVRVCGPEDLIAAVSARLGGLAAGIAFEAAPGPEVTVSAGETVIETELAAWSGLIAAAVAEA
ncbi:hypothetical protein [Methylorubrum zatmanii]|uniref:Flagellar assembly protein FliH n=1 Tax=Methylorubrum zatmanii TaxID=29429 RepID=A0ABW1WV54_9HYPH|nr:hypothetical protein [Methylorubrum zatmanii]MBD8907285.1 hypothetical protein [Methylorubrum zatmanii]